MMNNVHKSSRCAKPGAVPCQQALVIKVVRFFMLLVPVAISPYIDTAAGGIATPIKIRPITFCIVDQKERNILFEFQ